IKFLLYQRRLFQQADHLSPDDLIEELLSDEAAVVANRAAEFPPAIGANALVVVNLTCAGLRRCSREGVATLRTADQPLDDTRRDGTPARSYLVLLEQLLGTGEALFRHQGRHGDLDPSHASRGRSWPAVVLGVVTPRRRCGRITRVRAEMRVLPKQAAPRYVELRSTAQTVERSQRALALRVGMPSALILRVISPMLRP